MVAREDAVHEHAIDRPPIACAIFGEAFFALGQRRASFAGPHERVECESLHAIRMALRKQTRAQRAGRGAVQQQFPATVLLHDVFRRGRNVVCATGDIGVHGTRFVGASVAFAIDAARVVAKARKPVHRRRFRLTGNLQIENRRCRHRRAVHEKNCPAPRLRRRRSERLAPQEQPDVLAIRSLARPMLAPGDFGEHVHRCARLRRYALGGERRCRQCGRRREKRSARGDVVRHPARFNA